jgi:hypothetical protein
MLLAGIVITIAFIMTAMTLAQVSSLEREAATQETAGGISLEWRFIRDRLSSNLNAAATNDMSDSTFVDYTFPSIAETFRSVESEKGYDIVLRLAGASVAVNKTEASIMPVGASPLWSADGKSSIPAGTAYDLTNDGLIHYAPCPDPAAGGASCVGAVLVVVHLTDGRSTLEEVMLVGTNRT